MFTDGDNIIMLIMFERTGCLQLAGECCVLSWLSWWVLLLPRGCVSLSVWDLVLSVVDKQYERLRYVCVMVWDVFEVSSSQVLTCGRCGLWLAWG